MSEILLSSVTDYMTGQLDYLNLSSDEEEFISPVQHDNHGEHEQTESNCPEFYSFEDYQSENDEIFLDNFHNPMRNLICDSQQDCFNSKRNLQCSLSLPAMGFRNAPSSESHCPLRPPVKRNNLHRVNSGSSSSTNASSINIHIHPSSPEHRMQRRTSNRKRQLPLSKSWVAPEPFQYLEPCSVQGNTTLNMVSAIAASSPVIDIVYNDALLIAPSNPQHFNHPPKSKDNHSNKRTEELLNGIVKLVKEEAVQDDALSLMPQPPRRKPVLRSSHSSPLLTQLSTSQPNKPSSLSSPTAQAKRVHFSRKGSNSSQNSGEIEHAAKEKLLKKSKSVDEKHNQLEAAALFQAVEHFDLEAVISYVGADNSNINSINSEGLTVLDIAMLTNHVPLTKVLIAHGARPRLLRDNGDIAAKLVKLIHHSEQKITALKMAAEPLQKENEKKLNNWEFRNRLFRRMKNGYDQAGLPGQPPNVRLSVLNDSSLGVQFDAVDAANGAAVTRYKVEWSSAQNFRPLTGEVFLTDLQNLEYEIHGLNKGTAYFVRVMAWNMKGFSRPSASDPLFATPSSWRDVENFEARAKGFTSLRVHQLFAEVRKCRTSTEDISGSPADSPALQRKTVKRGIRGLFAASAKFQKTLKRGIYMACVFLSDEKVLTTTEDNLPIVEVDENYTGANMQADFDWLMKVTCSWDSSRQLKQDIDRLAGLSSVHLRSQLLTAVLQLQALLGTQDLGQLFYRPIRDGNGSVVFVLINKIKDPKQIGNMAALRWQPQHKLQKNTQLTDPLLSVLPEIRLYEEKCKQSLPKGLYLGYLRVKINVETIRVTVPEQNPNVLPHVKIRECPNVSEPEWQALLNLSFINNHRKKLTDPSDVLTFKKQVMKAAKKLLDKLEIPAEQIAEHRLYDVEVLEFSPEVAFIVLVPPRDLVCSFHSPILETDAPDKADYLDLPVKAFEMIHLLTYQDEFIGNYSKAACLIDTEVMIAVQAQREAFSNEEVEQTRKQVDELKKYQQQLEEVWRGTRWAMDIITYARDKAIQGVTLQQLYTSVMEQATIQEHGVSKNSDSDVGDACDAGYHSDKLSVGGSTSSDKKQLCSCANQNITNNNNGQYYDGQYDYHHNPAVVSEQLEPGILRVYAAYNCGLAKGTSVMLHVTPRTTSREVVNLVVMQLNQAMIKKTGAGPLYSEEHLLDFCLVAVIGPRERVLRDDYQVLLLQNPWTRGRLYVRLKTNLLAALEQGQMTDV